MTVLKGNRGIALGFVLGAVALLVVAPAVLSDFRLSLLGRFVCLAIVAVGIGLAWGRGGMLTSGRACSSGSAPTSWPCT
jgi:urea transport system permease protein